jgi:hypothetical protein
MNGAYHESSWTGAGDSTSDAAFAVRRFCGEMSDGRILSGRRDGCRAQRAIDCIRTTTRRRRSTSIGGGGEQAGIFLSHHPSAAAA